MLVAQGVEQKSGLRLHESPLARTGGFTEEMMR